MRAFAKEPAARYPDAAALAVDLASLRAGHDPKRRYWQVGFRVP
ncbi:MAG: hypothetical protein AB7N76_08705 [Planctomycetota bacterium]